MLTPELARATLRKMIGHSLQPDPHATRPDVYTLTVPTSRRAKLDRLETLTRAYGGIIVLRDAFALVQRDSLGRKRLYYYNRLTVRLPNIS